jgi:7-cyano-7-deazaguanine synthase
MTKQVVVLSGGLDSTTLLAHVRNAHPADDIYCLSFDYGQKHVKELDYALHQAATFDAWQQTVDLSSVTKLLAQGGSSLVTDDAEVPDGHYAEDSMKATVVPNRNMIMASIAIGAAVAMSADGVWMGVHAGDHFIYPDCRPTFFQALNNAAVIGNEGFGTIGEHGGVTLPKFVHTPFIQWSKNAIAARAFELDVDIAATWSCYKGGEKHCGTCGTCVERQEAIASTGHADPTQYEDNTFWKNAIASGR